MTDLGPEGRALLDAARNADDAEMHASRDRVRSALGRKLGVAAVGLTTTTAATTATAGIFTKVAIGLAFLGVVAGGAVVVEKERAPVVALPPKAMEAPKAALPDPAPIVANPPAPVPVEAAPVVVAPSAPSAKAIAQTAPAPAPSLSAELAALQAANEKLAAGKPGDTLVILDAMPKGGALGEERAGLRLLARCALGQSSASESARAFLAAHPSSPLAARLRSSCSVD